MSNYSVGDRVVSIYDQGLCTGDPTVGTVTEVTQPNTAIVMVHWDTDGDNVSFAYHTRVLRHAEQQPEAPTVAVVVVDTQRTALAYAQAAARVYESQLSDVDALLDMGIVPDFQLGPDAGAAFAEAMIAECLGLSLDH